MSLPLEDIQRAVCAWHNRHPLAERIAPDAVHSVGWVALPYMRAAQAQEPSLDGPATAPDETLAPPGRLTGPMQALLQRLRPGAWLRGPGPWPVFSESFIDGLTPQRVAAFASAHAWAQPVDNGSGWPQRRIDVDAERAEACHGAWPTERWLVAAAVDWEGERVRVLVGELRGRLAVLGAQRHRSRLRLGLAGGAAAAALALSAWALWPASSGADVQPPSTHASGVLATATAASGSPLRPAVPASGAASLPAAVPASAATAASAPAPVSSASAVSPAASAASAPSSEPAAEAVPDIRPRLGPVRASRALRTPREALQAKPPLHGETETAPRPAPANAATTAAPAASAPYRGAGDPEALRLGSAAVGPLVALASPGYPSKAEAEAQLARMREHVAVIVREGGALQGEVFETPQGWRAAVWPFATREEAQIVNATMVARGWKTRAVSF